MSKETVTNAEATTILKSMSKAAKARKMREWQAKLRQLPEVREEKIAVAKQRYQAGFYKENIDKLSDLLLNQ